MKKIALLVLALAIGVAGGFAKNKNVKVPPTRVLTGKIITKKGQPLAGVEVQATGGADMEVTNDNGEFSLEIPYWLKGVTITCPGAKKKNVKLKGREYIEVKLNPKQK